ncbi:9113_t:CDS:2, partial [Racocetra fulgida]
MSPEWTTGKICLLCGQPENMSPDGQPENMSPEWTTGKCLPSGQPENMSPEWTTGKCLP